MAVGVPIKCALVGAGLKQAESVLNPTLALELSCSASLTKIDAFTFPEPSVAWLAELNVPVGAALKSQLVLLPPLVQPDGVMWLGVA